MPVRFEDDLADEPGASSSPAGGGAHAAGQPLASAFGQRQSGVDWEELDEELYHVAPEFKDPRFDSLHHVLGILGAVDSEAALDEARAGPHACPSRLPWARCMAAGHSAGACSAGVNKRGVAVFRSGGSQERNTGCPAWCSLCMLGLVHELTRGYYTLIELLEAAAG